MQKLEEQLNKVFRFENEKSDEIAQRIGESERYVYDVIARQQQVDEHGGKEVEDAPTEEDFLVLEVDVSDVIADVHDLAKFTQLNYTGFQKIIKKHDVSAAGSSVC